MDRIHQKIYHLIEKRRNCLTSKDEEIIIPNFIDESQSEKDNFTFLTLKDVVNTIKTF